MNEERKNEAAKEPAEVDTPELSDEALSDVSGGGIFCEGPQPQNPSEKVF